MASGLSKGRAADRQTAGAIRWQSVEARHLNEEQTMPYDDDPNEIEGWGGDISSECWSYIPTI